MRDNKLIQYTQITSLPEDYIINKIQQFLAEDIPSKDITTDLFDNKNDLQDYIIKAKERMTVCGTPIISHCFSDRCEVQIYLTDGSEAQEGDRIGMIHGPFADVVAGERVMLNLLQRMSGIATLTSRLVKNRKNSKVQLLDTRKTTPGLRRFEKYAVSIGGGQNHRYDLSSGILIKENHIHSISSVKQAVELARAKHPNKIIEVEADSTKLATKLAELDIDSILIDNMEPADAKSTIEKVKHINPKIFIEVSGGISESNYQDYMDTGADAISMGCLTHSAQNMDISLIPQTD